MKQLFAALIATLLFSTSFAQGFDTWSGTKTTTTTFRGGLNADSVFRMPVRDTTVWQFKNDSTIRGRLTMRPQDSIVYAYNGRRWQAVGAGSPTESATAYVQSRTAMTSLTGLSANSFVYLTEAGRQGLFAYKPSGMSVKLAIDPLQGRFVPALDTGAGFERIPENNTYYSSFWGMRGGTANGEDTLRAIIAALPDYSKLVITGTVTFDSTLFISGRNGLDIGGEGWAVSRLKVTDAVQTNTPLYNYWQSSVMFGFDNCNDLKVHDLYFKGLYHESQANGSFPLFIRASTDTTYNIEVYRNKFDSCSEGVILNGTSLNGGSSYTPLKNVSVHHNTFNEIDYQGISFFGADNVNSFSNVFKMTQRLPFQRTVVTHRINGSRNCNIFDNIAEGKGTGESNLTATVYGVWVAAASTGGFRIVNENVNIHHNTFRYFAGGVYAEEGNNVKFVDNICDNGPADTGFSIGVTLASVATGGGIPYRLDRFDVSRNIFSGYGALAALGGRSGRVSISENTLITNHHRGRYAGVASFGLVAQNSVGDTFEHVAFTGNKISGNDTFFEYGVRLLSVNKGSVFSIQENVFPRRVLPQFRIDREIIQQTGSDSVLLFTFPNDRGAYMVSGPVRGTNRTEGKLIGEGVVQSNLLNPSYLRTDSATTGQVIKFNGSRAVWANDSTGGGGGTPGGSNTHIQFNSVGAFAGNSSLTFNGTNTLSLAASAQGGTIQISNADNPNGWQIRQGQVEAADFAILNNNAIRFHILSNGNIRMPTLAQSSYQLLTVQPGDGQIGTTTAPFADGGSTATGNIPTGTGAGNLTGSGNLNKTSNIFTVGSTAGGMQLRLYDDQGNLTNLVASQQAYGDFNLMQGAASRFYLKTGTGLVGIHTTSPAATLHVNGTDGIIVPVGTTAERSAVQGLIRYNTTTGKFEGYDGATWHDLH